MIKRDNFAEEHIKELQNKSKRDPVLIEDEPFEKVADYKSYVNEKFTQQDLVVVRYLKKVNLETYAYMIKVDRLLEKMRR